MEGFRAVADIGVGLCEGMKAAWGFGPGTTLRGTTFHPLGDGFVTGFTGAVSERRKPGGGCMSGGCAGRAADVRGDVGKEGDGAAAA